MIFNVYSFIDRVSGRERRVFFSETDGSACRDNIEFDVRSEKNPAGFPFKDIKYVCIAKYDSETHKFENLEPRELDILSCYEFRTASETPITKVDDSKK